MHGRDRRVNNHRPSLDETCLTVMAGLVPGLVPAIRSGRELRPMAGTSPAMTVRVTTTPNRVCYQKT
jgi:hypothetical protein